MSDTPAQLDEDNNPDSRCSDARNLRRRRKRVAILLAALLAVWVVASAIQVLRVYTAMDQGRDIAESARAKIAAGDLSDELPVRELRRSHDAFKKAHDRARNPLLTPTRILPIVGRQVRAVTSLSSAAASITKVGADAAAEVNDLLDKEKGPGPSRVDLLRKLADLAARADDRIADVNIGSGNALVSPIADAWSELATELGDLRTALHDGAAGARGAADLFAGPRRYLLFAANNAEMRAGSGMWLSVGILQTNNGAIDLQSMKSVTDVLVPPGAVTVEGDLAARWGWLYPQREWRNLMASPNFDASAELATRMWAAAGGGPVDGVLALDPVALKSILAVVGPVEVGEREINSGNVLDELFLNQYLRNADAPGDSQRREELGHIAEATLDALDSRDWSATELARSLADATRGRHILAWSSHPKESQAWNAAGMAGSLPDNALMLSVLSRGGTKHDQFLQVGSRVSFEDSGRNTDVTVRVTIRNTIPEGLPAYVAGPNPAFGVGPDGKSLIDEGSYLGMVTLNAPGSARFDPVRGGETLSTVGPDGLTEMTGTVIRLARGQTKVITFRFRIPGREGSLEIQPSARVPGIKWQVPTGRLADDNTHTVNW